MPYIVPARREWWDKKRIGLPLEISPGEINYVITRIVLQYVQERGQSYQTICEVTGVLENVKQEFYRRYAAPYEDSKIQTNGDVY